MGNKTHRKLFEVIDYSIRFHAGTEREYILVRDVKISIHPGEIVAVIGESGSGKSMLAQGLIGLLPNDASWDGILKYRGNVITPKTQAAYRGKHIFLLPQTVESLNPFMKTGRQIQLVLDKVKDNTGVEGLLQQVGLEPQTKDLYPFELSGGMARKVLGAMAFASKADLIIADEPTPGLDEVSLKAVTDILRKLAMKGKGILLITHDIRMALTIAAKVAVFQHGRVVEIADPADFVRDGEKLRHPYTKALWRALPENSFFVPPTVIKTDREEGGCPYAPHCRDALERCWKEISPLRHVQDGKERCFHA